MLLSGTGSTVRDRDRVASNGSGDQGSENTRKDWRARLGQVLVGLAGGLGLALSTTDLGWRGAAVIAAAGGVLLGAARLRRFPTEARLVVVSSWATWILAAVCTVIAAFDPFSWPVGYAVVAAALFAGAATVIPLDRYRAARALGGIATIGIGVCLISYAIFFFQAFTDKSSVMILLVGLVFVINPFILGPVAAIGAAISFLSAGIALLLRRDALISVAGVGLGVSLVGGGIVAQELMSQTLGLPAWLFASGAVAAIGAGVAIPPVRGKLIGVASIGFGLALIGIGIGIFPLSQASWLSAERVSLGTLVIAGGVVAIGAGVVFLFARGRLLGFAGVSLGLSLISAGIFVWTVWDTAHGIWLIAGGLVAISAGVVFLFARGRLLGFAGVGLGVALISAGIIVLLTQNVLLAVEPIAEPKLVGALGIGIAIGAFVAIGTGVAAVAAGVTAPLTRNILIGIAGICLGACLIGTGIIAEQSNVPLLSAWLLAVGVSLIGLAIAHLRRRWYVLGGIAAISIGLSFTVPGVQFLISGNLLPGAAAVGVGFALASVGSAIIVHPSQAELRAWVRSKWTAWTQAPSGPP
jgi:hypothetical protein